MIDDAIFALGVAVIATPHMHPEYPPRLEALGNALMLLYDHTRELEDISQAIKTHRRAIELTPNGHVQLPGRLHRLGECLRRRFERTGDLRDMTEAISQYQRAVQLCPDAPEIHCDIGNSFLRRYILTNELVDIQEAIAAHLQGLELIPDDHPGVALCHNSLGIALQLCFKAFGEPYMLAEAIAAHRRVVELCPESSPLHIAATLNLGTSYSTSFEHFGHRSDIDAAITANQRVVQLGTDNDGTPDTAYRNLGSSFLERFSHYGDPHDVDEAISAFRLAVELTPKGSVDLPRSLCGLGDALHDRSLSTGSPEDLEASIAMFKSAATCSRGPLRIKIRSAMLWARHLSQRDPQSPEVTLALDTAIRLIPLMAGLDRRVQIRYWEIRGASAVALEAAALACRLDISDKAVEWLEQGRCLVWSQLSALSMPLDDLRQYDTALAERLTDVAHKLQTAGSWREMSSFDMALSEKISAEDEALAHSDLANEWERLLLTARAIPGFETFLLPSPCSSLLQYLPTSGPVIVINVDETRCDAIALVHGLDEPLHIPLPDFSLERAKQYRRDLHTKLVELGLSARGEESDVCTLNGTSSRPAGKYRRKKQVEGHIVHNILRDLWDLVVKPVLDALGFSVSTHHCPYSSYLTSAAEMRSIVGQSLPEDLVVSHRSFILPSDSCSRNIHEYGFCDSARLCCFILYPNSDRSDYSGREQSSRRQGGVWALPHEPPKCHCLSANPWSCQGGQVNPRKCDEEWRSGVDV